MRKLVRTEIKIEKCDKPYCVIHTETETEGICKVAESIRKMDESGKIVILTAWDGDYCIQLKIDEVFRIFSMEKKVYVETEKEVLLLKMRLYEFEELSENYGWTDFIRISNTDIVNFSKITSLDMSISGVVKVNLINGSKTVISRRFVTKIKKQLNMIHKK